MWVCETLQSHWHITSLKRYDWLTTTNIHWEHCVCHILCYIQLETMQHKPPIYWKMSLNNNKITGVCMCMCIRQILFQCINCICRAMFFWCHFGSAANQLNQLRIYFRCDYFICTFFFVFFFTSPSIFCVFSCLAR